MSTQIAEQDKKSTAPTPNSPQIPRLALLCDFSEEGWRSMDLFGDVLTARFTEDHTNEITVEQLRPLWRPRFSRIPVAGRSGLARNADRLWNRFRDYPRWLRPQSPRFDIFHIVDHSYSQLVHELPAGRTVVTCHDLDTFRCLLEPELDPRPRWFRAMAQRTLDGFRKCAHVITVSEATRAELLRLRLFPAGQVTVIPPGVDSVYFNPSDPVTRDRIPRPRRGPYLLHVGSTIRRKRIDVLLRVFAAVRKRFPDLQLVRVGGALTPEQFELAASLGVDQGLIQSPPLSAAELSFLYQGDALLLQPSDAEGFGLPVIESMASGCPVIASDIPPLHEAGGEAAEYCAVADIDAWSDAIQRLLAERAESPHLWQARRKRAQHHARNFSWARNADRTLEIYRQVLANG